MIRKPSGRNHALYRAYKVDGWSQTDLAREFGLTQGRVSQIIRRFEEWRAMGAPTGTCDSLGKPQSASRSHAESLRLERWLEHERSEAIYTRSIRAFDHAPSRLTTTRTEKRPAGDVQIETKREVAPPAQFLRLARQASLDLGRLADKEPPPQPELEPTDEQRLAAIREHLSHFRSQAEANNEVPKSEFPGDIINYWLAAFLGDRSIWIDPADLTPGSPLHELLNFFNPDRDAPPQESEPTTTDTELPDHAPSTLDIGPETLDSSPPNTPENPAISTSLSSNTSNKPNTNITPSRTLDLGQGTLDSPLARRLAHERKLEQLKEFRRRGLPIMLEFDPEDGPLPTIHHPGDHCITTPGIY